VPRGAQAGRVDGQHGVTVGVAVAGQPVRGNGGHGTGGQQSGRRDVHDRRGHPGAGQAALQVVLGLPVPAQPDVEAAVAGAVRHEQRADVADHAGGLGQQPRPARGTLCLVERAQAGPQVVVGEHHVQHVVGRLVGHAEAGGAQDGAEVVDGTEDGQADGGSRHGGPRVVAVQVERLPVARGALVGVGRVHLDDLTGPGQLRDGLPYGVGRHVRCQGGDHRGQVVLAVQQRQQAFGQRVGEHRAAVLAEQVGAVAPDHGHTEVPADARHPSTASVCHAHSRKVLAAAGTPTAASLELCVNRTNWTAQAPAPQMTHGGQQIEFASDAKKAVDGSTTAPRSPSSMVMRTSIPDSRSVGPASGMVGLGRRPACM
jgi:hypothetical protein